MNTSSSSDLADAVERVARSVLAVAGSRRSVGSATVWRDGFIVAAAHRVARADSAQVLLPNGETANAAVKGIDPSTDLALLALDASTPALPVPERADAAAGSRAGEFVFAVARDGSGLTQASFGHVGAAAGEWRTWRGGRVDRLIRLDGGLYPGYSGAPAADARGRTLGIATSGLTRMHGIVLPWSTVDRVLEQLQAHGRIAPRYLGIVAQPVRLRDAQAAALGVSAGSALLLTAVADDGPAAAAGLLLGDVLVAIDGTRVASIDDLREVLSGHAVGDEIAVLVARGGERKEVSARIGERAEDRVHACR